MNGPALLRERLRRGPPLLLDSAMGTELERRGCRCELPLWSARALIDDPELVRAIHADDVAAGADVLTANTFRTHGRTAARAGTSLPAAELTRRAVRLAREAAGSASHPVFVVGSLSPLEDCYRPDLVPNERSLAVEHAAQARELASAGVDGILLETHNTIRELAAAARAGKETGLPVIASMVTDGKGRLLSGEPIDKAADALAPIGPDAVSINCVPARRLAGDLGLLARAAKEIPLGAYGNLGPPTGSDPMRFEQEVPPEEYAALAAEWIELGARLVGGCCGTTAAHTAALRKTLHGRVL